MTLLLFQMSVVLAVTLSCGWLARRMGQSRVIGEIVGGILLGPSVFGRLAPHTAATLFPPASFAAFDVLSTVGLILFLFVVGIELNGASLRRHHRTAVMVSVSSMLLPFSLAAAIAPLLRSRFAPDGVSPVDFTLIVGVSLSITAFPVLARILTERRMQTTALGSIALLCAAVDDVCAWSLLAVAMTLLPQTGQAAHVGSRMLWLATYIAVMIAIVRPLSRRLAARWEMTTAASYEMLGAALTIVLLSATVTDAIGVHPLFGAFLAGACFPRVPRWQAEIKDRIETLTSALLLPFFFALTGMRTRLDLLNSGHAWLWTLLLVVVAIAGKMGGATAAARWSGEPWRNALALGALLNTRGLVELIVLNIAYSAGIFSPELFSMFVVMALVTTMMTTPILNLLRITGDGDKVPAADFSQ